MFSNAKIGLLVLVFFLSGCGGGNAIIRGNTSIEYRPAGNPASLISSDKQAVLFLYVEDNRPLNRTQVKWGPYDIVDDKSTRSGGMIVSYVPLVDGFRHE